MRVSLPLIGLQEDGLLPGEERTFEPPALAKVTVAALAGRAGEAVAVVTITSAVELPSLVAQRWATEAIVVAPTDKGVTLRGRRRVQILSASGREGAFTAEVLATSDPLPSPAELLSGARAVLDALGAGAAPDVPEWQDHLGSALLGMVRALAGVEGLTEAQRHPPAAALASLARTLVARSPAVHGARALEGVVGELAAAASLREEAAQAGAATGGAATAAKEGAAGDGTAAKGKEGAGKDTAGAAKGKEGAGKDAAGAAKGKEGAGKDAAGAAKVEVPAAMKQRLWSQVVEIQKRLDVYDPGVGKDGDDLGLLQRRLMQAGMPRIARETAKRELRLLRGMPATHHDHATYYAHLDFMARLPWQPDSPPPLDLDGVAAALEREHFGLGKAKQRVLEHLAVRALGGESASMILCLSGPPGVGKTSVARSIAGALGRRFVQVPLGGVHDESEIRGHRLSFTAASAGRVLRGLAQAGSASAVMLLDEVDKIGSDRQRSPAAALLEVLDPEQNAHFQDNYLGVPFDLSHVLFIATANETGAMHPALRDRMEPIEIEGYTTQEKVKIAEVHLVRRVAREVGLPAPPPFEPGVLAELVEHRTREAGVRQLKRVIGELYRSRALALVRAGSREAAAPAPITAAELTAVLGPAPYLRRALPETASPGVAVGLSVGPEGGSILFIEVGLVPGKGRLRLTGRVGEVMEESVKTALSFARIHAARLGLPPDRLASDVHLHAPEGAIPKDGPSAGVAVLVALVSAFRGAAPAADVAITGEISLAGHVLRVGGVRAKVLAAERAGVRRVIVPADNLPDVPADARVTIVPVRTADEALAAAFSAPE